MSVHAVSSRRRRWWIIGSALVVFLIGLAVMVGSLLYVGESNIERVQVDGIGPIEEGEEVEEEDFEELDGVLNVLVVGSDRRDGLSGEARRELGTGDAEGDRTDTIMLVRLDPETDQVDMMSFPRDLLVTRCDGSRGKINAAYQIGEHTGRGGASCLVQTLTQLSGLPIHHLIEVDFAGFLDIVDIVDGVTVYLEEPIDDWRAKLDLAAGCQRLTGVEALGFVRHRASDSDYGRMARQQRFIKELVREASSIGSLLNVPRLFSMVEAGASSVTTDQDLSLDKMRQIAFSLRGVDDENLVARTVPADFEMIDDIAFEIPREAEAARLYAAFSEGRLGDEPEPVDDEDSDTERAPTLMASDVPPIVVFNATSTGGLAGAFSEELESAGFRVQAVDNSDSWHSRSAVVRHPPHLADEAELLSEYLPGAELEELAEQGSIHVVLGAGADPARFGEPSEGDVLDEEGDGPGAGEAEPGDGLEDDEVAPPPDEGASYLGAQEPPAYCR